MHVQLRLNEHALHTWDVEVVLDPNATLPTDAAAVIVDQLGMLVQCEREAAPASSTTCRCTPLIPPATSRSRSARNASR